MRLTHDALPVVTADPSAMRVVFRRLLSKALKYTRTREEARIWIFTRTPGANT
ncbi:hypothetical protein [Deinococcus apachensis]|uniref:hypothetical protein n=1 Tax=Deinococcus apachensis TaxID=309886 RepID=UPI0003A8050C|nr:hypothetical protein [Deinococcus apachensis]